MTTHTYIDDKWEVGNINVFGIRDNAAWLGMSTFDGVRSFDGVQPDLDLHCKRSIRSAKSLMLNPEIKWNEIQDIVLEGVSKFDEGAHLYIRITFWDSSNLREQRSDAAGFSVCLWETPLVFSGFTANMSKFIRPSPQQAPTNAKASCLYPNSLLAINAANNEGFDDGVMLDIHGRVTEFTMSNLFYIKNNEIYTPKVDGHFLNGITRQRFIKLLRNDGYTVHEKDIMPDDLENVDEIFSTGNMSKIKPCIQYKNKLLGIGPVTQHARDLYMAFAHKG